MATRLPMSICVAALFTTLVAATGLLEQQHEGIVLLPIDDPTLMPSAEEVAASRVAFEERARGGASAWDARLGASSAQARRRAQEGGNSPTPHNFRFKYDSSALSGGADVTWASAMTEPAAVACTDEAAENLGASEPCQYSCATLRTRFLPHAPLEKTRCFIYDRDSETWPESTAGRPAAEGADAADMSELLSMRMQTQDWHIYLEKTANLPAVFDVGEGETCVNVTVQVSISSDIYSDPELRTEHRCLEPGHHEYNHTVDAVHSVEVVGYVNSSLQQGPGGTTPFVVGECIDTFIRVQTTFAPSSVTWWLDDDGHNGPWQFVSPAGSNHYEHSSCMFDNRFSLYLAPNMEWQGTVEVITKEDFKNTIIVPNDEQWIVQGVEGLETAGVPVQLQARFESGRTFFEHGCDKHGAPNGQVDTSEYPLCTSESISRASLVVRHVRFSHQQAPLDPFRTRYTFSVVPGTALGGVLRYTGGWGAKLIFQHCVFDHLWATTGTTFVIDGQMDEYARPPFYDATKTPEDLRIIIEVSNCLFWELDSLWLAVRVVDAYPTNCTLTDNQFIDNYAFVSSAWNIGMYGNSFPDGFGVQGISYHSFIRNELSAMGSPNPEFNFEMGGFVSYLYPQHWPAGPGSIHPDVSTKVVVEDLYCHDYNSWAAQCLLAFNYGNYNGGAFDVTVVGTQISDVTGAWMTTAYGGSAIALLLDRFVIARTRVANGGFSRDRDPDETNGAEGTMYLLATEYGRLESVHITGSGSTGKGGAVALKGTAAFEIINCVFEGNVAIADGGAIFFTSTGPLFVQNAVFVNNKAKRQVEILQQIVVNVFTGGGGVGQDMRPVWKLDGDPPDLQTGHCGNEVVYGNSTYHQAYQPGQLYAEVVTTTTGEHTLWFGAEVFTTGSFSDWEGGGWISVTGIVTKLFPTLCDNRARTDCPAPNDFARYPGCYNAGVSASVPEGQIYCPVGEAFWSSITFMVPSGTGGAIAIVGTGAVTIKSSTFDDNQAGFGNAVAATGSEQLTVEDTSFGEVTPNTFYLEGVESADCRQHPCSFGERCTVDRLSLHCEPCPNGQTSVDGIECQMCEPGKQHNENHTACIECVEGKYSSATTSGVCEPCTPGTHPASNYETCTECPAGSFSAFGISCIPCAAGHFSTAAAAFCTECPAGTASGEGRIVCESCSTGRARSQGQPDCMPCDAGMEPDAIGQSCITCDQAGYVSHSGQSCAPCEPGKQPFVNRTGCSSCPVGMAGIAGTCELCQAGRYAESETTCSPCDAGMEPTEDKGGCQCKVGTYDSTSFGLIACGGAAHPPSSDVGRCTECPPCLDCSVRGVTRLKEGWAPFGTQNTMFTCPYPPACPQRTLNESSLMDQTCARGYDPASPLCAMCAAEYNAYKVGQVCDPCDDVTINIPLLIGLLAVGLIAVASAVTGAYAWLVENGMTTDLRIMLGLYQILAQADTVLRIIFPSPVPELMAIAKLLFLDIRTLLHMDCFELGGFYAQLVTNLFALPVLAAFACFVYYLNEKKTIIRMVAEGVTNDSGLQSAKLNFQRNLMIGVFVMYPMMTTTLFRIPMCRELNGAAFHESDYWVSCDSSTFTTVLVFGVFGVLLVPIGIPLAFYLKMRSTVQELGGEANESATGGAKLVADDQDDASDRFAFLCQDYKPSAWYWEIVSYVRKLCLNGWAVVVGRGTMGQIYFATLTSAVFLILHIRVYPFVVPKHNTMEAIGEATLLLMYTTCLLLRNEDQNAWDDEWVTRTGYGWILVVMYVVICPSPMFFSLYIRLTSQDQPSDDETQFMKTVYENPLGDAADSTATGEPTSMPVSNIEQRVRSAKQQQRKTKSLVAELAKARASATKAQEELAELKAKAAAASGGIASGAAYTLDTRRASQVNALKGLAAESLVDQETVQRAQQRFSTHVLYEIERDRSLREYLNSPDVRLGHYTDAFLTVGGAGMAAEDVPLLSAAEMARLIETAQMTQMEARRLAAVVHGQQTKQPSDETARSIVRPQAEE